MLSVMMFSSCFWMSNKYREISGSGFRATLESNLLGGAAGTVGLLLINGLQLDFTPFTLVMSLWSVINGLCFAVFSRKAMDRVNLSVYSLFAMLGGMVLPFIHSIIFFGEPLTLAKGICFALISVSLILTVERGNGKRNYKSAIYYGGVFIFNGMSGVISKIFASAPFEKTNAAVYSLYGSFWNILISSVLLIVIARKTPKLVRTPVSIGCAMASGFINKIGNFILVFSLAFVHASVQYPMVTGGTIIFSTLFAFFGKKKPKKKELISVAVAFLAVLLLVLIPI